MEKDKLEAGQIWMWKPQDYNIATTFFDVVMVSEDGTFAGNFEYTNSDVFFEWRKNVPCSEILNDESWHRVKAGDFAAAVRMMFRREITMSRFTDKIKELDIERDMYKRKCEKLQNLMNTQKVNRK